MTTKAKTTKATKTQGQPVLVTTEHRGVFFGYLIGVTGCYYGMTAQGGTEGVGQAATRSVVVSIFLVLVSNVLLVRLIQLGT